MKTIDLETGTVLTLADAPQLRGGVWGDDGTILFSKGGGGLLRLSAEGNEAREVTKPDANRKENDHRWPHFLPGSRAALFEVVYDHAVSSSGSGGHDVAVLDLRTGTTRILVEEAGFPKYASGHLLFGRNGIVYAVGIDVEKLELRGTPVPVLEGVAMWSSPGDVQSASGFVYYDISRDGALVFSPREARLPQRTLVLVDREGRRRSISHSKQTYTLPHFSPDGRRIAVTVEMDVGSRGAFLLDVATDAWTRVGSDGDLSAAAWLPDGKRLLLNGSWSRNTGMLLAHVDASEPPQEVHLGEAATLAVAPDGVGILFAKENEPAQWDIWRLMLRGRQDSEPWLATTSRENSPSFSPDGRWVAYRSDESGRTEIYARPYAGQSGRHQVSTRGGVSPRWSPDGKEIFFSSLVARNGNQGSLWSVAVRTTPSFAADPPRKLFDLSDEILTGRDFYDVSPDGQHFVMVQKDPFELRPLDLVIVPGWIEEMKARLAAAK